MMNENIRNTFTALTQYPQWILCVFKPSTNGKTDKIPIDRFGDPINAHYHQNWLNFEEALELRQDLPGCERTKDSLENCTIGIGFVLTKDDPFFFVDIDACLVDGQWSPLANKLCAQLAGAGVEVSNSGEGLHIIGQGTVTKNRCIREKSNRLELYTEGRFVAITGTSATGSASTDHTAALADIVAEYLPLSGHRAADIEWTTEPVPEWVDPGPLPDRALAARSVASRLGGVSFSDLWECNGDKLGERWPDDQGSKGRAFDASRADLALAQHLAFWTGKDCDRISELMWASGLARDDRWNSGGYLERTVLRAVSQQTEVYTGGKTADITERLNRTDVGNGRRLVSMYKDSIHYSFARKAWLVWDGKRWVWDQYGWIKEYAKQVPKQIFSEAGRHELDKDERKALVKHAFASEKSAAITSMLTMAQSESGVPIDVDQLDAGEHLVNCQNGTLDLRTCELKPHSKEDMITKITACDYVPGATSEIWDNFLQGVTWGDTDLVAYLQRVFGYALLGVIREKHLWFMYGPPDSGKSTLINSIYRVFGGYSCAAGFDTWLIHSGVGGNRGDIVDLMGSRLVVSVEVRKGAKFDEALIKSVTGGDRIKAAAKYEKEVEFTAQFVLVLAGNDAPIVRDDDEAFWKRMIRVPFPRSIPDQDQDKTLDDTLQTTGVQQAILAWLVGGYSQWEKHGLGTCRAVEKSNSEYRAEMDRVAAFFEDELEFSNVNKISVQMLRNSYELWASEYGVKMLSVREFNRRLRERGCEQYKSNGARGWCGVSVRAENVQG